MWLRRTEEVYGQTGKGHRCRSGLRDQGSDIHPKGLDAKEVNVLAGITTRGLVRPVRWACNEPLNADGSLTAKVVSFSNPRWRKGI
jgi:hypothetical protein